MNPLEIVRCRCGRLYKRHRYSSAFEDWKYECERCSTSLEQEFQEQCKRDREEKERKEAQP